MKRLVASLGVAVAALGGCVEDVPAPTRTPTPSLKIVAPPDSGIYLGAYDQRGGIAAFEKAIGRKVAIAANLPYYSATIIAAGDPAERFFALAKLRDPRGRPLTDVIENVVVGRVGNYVVFPLRSADFTTADWRSALTAAANAASASRAWQEQTITLPLPGIWLRSELFPAQLAGGADDAGAADETPDAGRAARRKRG